MVPKLSVLMNFFNSSNFTILIILFCSFALSNISSNRLSRKAYYGSPCNTSVKCDIHSLLMCEENVCQCLYPDAMEYNADLGTCVSLVNEICGYLETKRVFINCAPNAYCDQQQGVCKCSQGYVERERYCIKQKNYGESCHSDNECLSELSLTCFEEVCQCDPQRHQPSFGNTPSGTKCVALAGLPCTTKLGCVAKSTCSNEFENDEMFKSVGFNWMHYTGICQCDKGYEIDQNRKCRGQFGSACDVLANVSCISKLQCLNGVCGCKYPNDQVFDPKSGACVSLVGGPCTNDRVTDDNEDAKNDSDTIFCDKFMECTNSVCQCKSGFVMNPTRGCDLSFGQTCTGETMNKCDAAAGLYCVDGTCSCVDRQKQFDSKTGRCVGRIGSSCKVTRSSSSCNPATSLEKGDLQLPCSESMKCQVSRAQLEGETSTGFCVPLTGGDESLTEAGKMQYDSTLGFRPDTNEDD